MKNGELSNRSAPRIVINADTVLFKDRDNFSILERIKRRFSSYETNYLSREIDATAAAILESMWRVDVAIWIISFDLSTPDALMDKLSRYHVPFSEVICCTPEYVTEKLNSGFFHYFFCLDEDIISQVGRHAMSFKEWRSVFW